VKDFLQELLKGYQLAHDSLTIARQKSAKSVQHRRNPKIKFEIGDLVAYRREAVHRNTSKKLQPIWIGLFEVIDMDKSYGNYKLLFPSSIQKCS